MKVIWQRPSKIFTYFGTVIKLLHTDSSANRVTLSEFQKYDGATQFDQVAAKFVLNGEETYHINERKYTVKKGEYIIGNGGQLAEVQMKELTAGLCVDISNEVIREVAALYFDQSDFLDFLLGDKFLVNKYKTKNTSLGMRLQSFGLHNLLNLKAPNKELFNEELFLSLGESIVMDQSTVFNELSKLDFKKRVVNEENYRKLLETKDFMDAHFLAEIDVASLTHTACMSKFNFIRLFKLTFGLSPYQYLLNKRLNFAKNQILSGEQVTDVAFQTGFANVAAFSKAFKSHFSVAPSKVQ